MKSPHPLIASAALPGRALVFLAIAGILLCPAVKSTAQSSVALTVLHAFAKLDDSRHNRDGSLNRGYLREGPDGNLYGVAPGGGANGNGTIFRVSPAGNFVTLHTFSATDDNGANVDGASPNAGLVVNADGSLYGTTLYGGATGNGTLFKLTSAGELSTVYNFTITAYALNILPSSGLIRGADGNVYGVYSPGGPNQTGSIFKLSPAGTVTTLYNFDPDNAPNLPVSLIQGSDGYFYGVTDAYYGGIFQYTPGGLPTTVAGFGSDYYEAGAFPQANLVQGADGALYGTNVGGGANDTGTIFRLTTAGDYSVLHTFIANDSTLPCDGWTPREGMILGQDGNFYGTTTAGGAHGRGTIYQLTPGGVYRTYYSFDGVDGADPACLLTQASDGSLYGSTTGGGNDFGVIFKLAVSKHPAFFSGEALLDSGVQFLSFSNGNSFGYYSYLDDPSYIYHYDLGFEYVIDAADGNAGVYLYDFASDTFFYTSPSFPFPYLYDFSLKSVLYYYPNPDLADRYNIDGVRTFYDFATGERITK